MLFSDFKVLEQLWVNCLYGGEVVTGYGKWDNGVCWNPRLLLGRSHREDNIPPSASYWFNAEITLTKSHIFFSISNVDCQLFPASLVSFERFCMAFNFKCSSMVFKINADSLVFTKHLVKPRGVSTGDIFIYQMCFLSISMVFISPHTSLGITSPLIYLGIKDDYLFVQNPLN